MIPQFSKLLRILGALEIKLCLCLGGSGVRLFRLRLSGDVSSLGLIEGGLGVGQRRSSGGFGAMVLGQGANLVSAGVAESRHFRRLNIFHAGRQGDGSYQDTCK